LKKKIAALDAKHKPPARAVALASEAKNFERTMVRVETPVNDRKVEELEAQLRKVAIAGKFSVSLWEITANLIGMDEEMERKWRSKATTEEFLKHSQADWDEALKIADEIEKMAGLPPTKVDRFLTQRREAEMEAEREARRQANFGAGDDDDLYTASPPGQSVWIENPF
jgi:hypothetical protein